MTNNFPEILYEDNHLLAVLKSAGVLTMGDDTGDETMADIAREYLRVRYNKPGNVFLGVVHRLDRPVSGVLLFARTSKAASRLSDQFRKGSVRKLYHAVVDGPVREPEATLTDWLIKDSDSNFVRNVSKSTPGAKESILKYRVLSSDGAQTHLEVEPLTGRSHQIRVQLASRGMPVIGDVKYGSNTELGHEILLHAKSLEFDHPTKKNRVNVTAPVTFRQQTE